MDEKLREMGLAEIRESGAKDNEISFSKGILGGYNVKEVDNYIKVLKDRLAGAENSFRDRLDEYSVMTSMLTQEKDKYKALYEKTVEDSKSEHAVLSSFEIENNELKQKLEAVKKRILSEEQLEKFKAITARSVILEKIASEHEDVLAENIMLSEELDKLKVELDGRDKQLTALSEIDSDKNQRLAFLSAEMESYKKRNMELSEMERIVSEQKKKLDRFDVMDTEKLQKINALSSDNEQLKKQCSELDSKNNQLVKSLELLQQAEEQLSIKLNNYIMNEINRNDYNALVEEVKLIREQREELATEKNIILSEKKLLTDENMRLSDQVSRLNKRNCELHHEQGKTRIHTGALISDIKARTYEYSQNHKKNYELMSESIKMLAQLIDSENEDISHLIGFQSNISLCNNTISETTSNISE